MEKWRETHSFGVDRVVRWFNGADVKELSRNNLYIFGIHVNICHGGV